MIYAEPYRIKYFGHFPGKELSEEYCVKKGFPVTGDLGHHLI
jgi:hypothetical protein